MKLFIKKNINLPIIIALALWFFFAASAFNFFTQSYSEAGDFVKWTSPDETANYTFAKLYGQEDRLTIQEDYNLQLEDVMRPRSFRSDHGVLKPVSFLGIILVYGKIVSLTSYKYLPYITPFLAALGIIFYYLFIRRIFSEKIAFISAIILAFFPPFLYYSARSMFHNVPFVVFLLIGIYFSSLAFCTPEKQKFRETKLKIKNLGIMASALLSGFFLGLSIVTRTSELLWIGPVLLLALILNIKRINFLNLPLLLGGLTLAIAPMAYHNQILYGSPFFGGYAEMNQSIIEIVEAGASVVSFSQSPSQEGGGLLGTLQSNIFRFGFHERFSLEMFKYYFVEMFSIVFWTAVLGFILFVFDFKKQKYGQYVYLMSLVPFSAFLVLYYGSWEFHDNPDPNQYTIGNSYTRYWLPVYLGVIPFSALFFLRVKDQLKKIVNFNYLGAQTRKFLSFSLNSRLLDYFLILLLLSIYIFASINFVLLGSSEGLLQTAFRQRQSQDEQKHILELTESNSVIITRYHDKLLFPERKVIVGLFDDQAMNKLYAKIAKELPLYYYNFRFSEKDFNYLNDRRLKEAGLKIKEVQKIDDVFTLYKLDIENN